MKALIILATLIAAPVFADVHLEIKGVEGDAKDTADQVIEGDLLNAPTESREAIEGDLLNTRVIDNEETADEINGQIEFLSPNLESKTKAQDYNSSRPNKRGAQAPNGDHNSTRSNRGRRLDEDSDDDGVLTKEVCNAVDNDCDDDRADSTTEK